MAKLDQADTIYTQTLPLITRGREVLQRHTAHVESLRDALQAQIVAQQNLTDQLRVFRQRREVDPHWQTFRERCEESESYLAQLGKMVGECRKLLTPELPEPLGDDPTLLETIYQRVVWSGRMLEALEQQISRGREQIGRLRTQLQKPGP